jgi:hypothetical protein
MAWALHVVEGGSLDAPERERLQGAIEDTVNDWASSAADEDAADRGP